MPNVRAMFDLAKYEAEKAAATRAEQKARDDRLARIEAKLDMLIATLAADEGDEPVTSLDGRQFAARDEAQGLG